MAQLLGQHGVSLACPVSVLVRSNFSLHGGSKLCSCHEHSAPAVGQVYGSGFMAHALPAGLVP
jgi:hypothetical protein